MTFIEGYKTQTRLEHTEHLNESFTCMAIVDHTIDDDSYCIPGVSEQGEGRPLPPPPPMLEEGGAEYHLTPKNVGDLCPLGLVFFTLENVLCLLFESAIPGGKTITFITPLAPLDPPIM